MSRWYGYLLVALSALGFATLGIFAKYAFAYGINSYTLLTWRFSLAALLLWAWVLIRQQPIPAVRDLIWLTVMGAAGYNAMSQLYLTANRLAPAGLAAAVLYTYPALVTLQVTLLGWEPLTGRRVFALAASAAGCALVVLNGTSGAGGEAVTGALYALGAAAVYSVYVTLGSLVLKRVPAVQATAGVCTSAALALGLTGGLTGQLQPVPVEGYWTVAGLSLLATVLAVLTFYAGIQRIGPAQASIASTLEPVGAAVLGAVLLGEYLGPWQLAGGLLVLASIVMLQAAPRRQTVPAEGEVSHG